MNLSTQQLHAVELVEAGAPVFLSGMAGTGKSTVTAAIVGHSRGRIDLCATTGIAALNLQQQFLERTGLQITARTIYRYAGIGLGPAPGQCFDDYSAYLESTMNRTRRAAYTRIRSAETVVIDEISMLPGRLLDFLDHHFRRVRECTHLPFGGVQLVMVGDFLQLPPVAKTGLYDWAFRCRAWREAGLRTCYLTQIFRQNEPDFVDALNDFRVGRVSGRTAAVLGARVARFPSRNIPRLFTHNVQVDKWNAYQLENIDEHAPRTFTANTSGAPDQVEFLIKNLVTPQELVLKRSARVMFTANLSDGNGGMIAANGECGTVLDFDRPTLTGNDGVLVRKDDGQEVAVGPFVWTFDPQDDDSAKFIQHPLRLAYSLTIHKSQGLTLDAALIDIRAAREPGQAYVALSRLRSLRGLYLKDWFSGIVISPDAIAFYREIEARQEVAA